MARGLSKADHLPEYIVWSSFKQRVYNPKHKSYANYGGRGIKVCDRWRNSFQNFYEDMGDRPEGLTLRWIACICIDYKRIHLGTFDTISEAKKARKHAEIVYGVAS